VCPKPDPWRLIRADPPSGYALRGKIKRLVTHYWVASLQARRPEPRPEEKRGTYREKGQQPKLATSNRVLDQRVHYAARALVAHAVGL